MSKRAKTFVGDFWSAILDFNTSWKGQEITQIYAQKKPVRLYNVLIRAFCNLMKKSGKIKYRIMSNKLIFSQTFINCAIAMAALKIIDIQLTNQSLHDKFINSHWKSPLLKINPLLKKFRGMVFTPPLPHPLLVRPKVKTDIYTMVH